MEENFGSEEPTKKSQEIPQHAKTWIKDIGGALEIYDTTRNNCVNTLIESTKDENAQVHTAFTTFVSKASPLLPELIPLENQHYAASGNYAEAAISTWFVPKSCERLEIQFGFQPSELSPEIDPKSSKFMGVEALRKNSRGVRFKTVDPNDHDLPRDYNQPWLKTSFEHELVDKMRKKLAKDRVNSSEVNESLNQFDTAWESLEEEVLDLKTQLGGQISNRVVQVTDAVERHVGKWRLPRFVEPYLINDRYKGMSEGYYYLPRDRKLIYTSFERTLLRGEKPDIKNGRDARMDEWFDVGSLLTHQLFEKVGIGNRTAIKSAYRELNSSS